jgi:hypothetical protein
MKLMLYLTTAMLAAWLLLQIDNPLREWAMERYAVRVSAGLEREMNWSKR